VNSLSNGSGCNCHSYKVPSLMPLSLKRRSGMQFEKVPGSDGFTGIFYKTCWSIIKSDVMAAFDCIFNQQTGPMHKLNTAVISLLPKREVSETLADFRPISLIHSFAKLVSKVLAIRLSAQIDRLVSPSQSAFIKKRCIQDNFMYVRKPRKSLSPYKDSSHPSQAGHFEGL
jgi:hypothetical protein